MGNSHNCDCGADDWGETYSDCDCHDEEEDYFGGPRRREAMQADRVRRERFEDADPDEYALVPSKGGRGAVGVAGAGAAISPRDLQDREMSVLKVEEQRIKNKIATERLAFDVQKRQQSKEMHDIKLAVIRKYPNVLFNRQNVNDMKSE